LRHGIEAKPTIVKPNQAEAEALLSNVLLMRTQYLNAADTILRMGPENVVLSLGSRGVVSAFCWKDAGADSAAGGGPSAPSAAGDALSAALVNALETGSDFRDALRWGVAAGNASAALRNAKFATRQQAHKIYDHVNAQGRLRVSEASKPHLAKNPRHRFRRHSF